MLELLRKMILIGVVSIVYPGSLLQVFIAITFCIGFVTAVAWLRPFKDGTNNREKTQSEVALLFIYVMTVFSKADLSTEGAVVRRITEDLLGVCI